jgi:hypothetical protein
MDLDFAASTDSGTEMASPPPVPTPRGGHSNAAYVHSRTPSSSRHVYNNQEVQIMQRDLLTQKCAHKKKGYRVCHFGYPEHVDSENIKLTIGSRSLLYQLFQNVI